VVNFPRPYRGERIFDVPTGDVILVITHIFFGVGLKVIMREDRDA
jgi:hypothetical protein